MNRWEQSVGESLAVICLIAFRSCIPSRLIAMMNQYTRALVIIMRIGKREVENFTTDIICISHSTAQKRSGSFIRIRKRTNCQFPESQ